MFIARGYPEAAMTLKKKIDEMEREAIVNALKESDWVMVRAARMLGITERMISYKIKKLGISIKKTYEKEDESTDKSS
jgi:transcriptional regulator with GAF, ATPase, and Fis domain